MSEIEANGPMITQEAADAISQLPDHLLAEADDPSGEEVREEEAPASEEDEAVEAASEEGQSEDTDSNDESEDVLVVVNLPGGETKELPLTEVVKGYSRESDYTQKTQQLAKERAEMQKASEAERGQYMQRLQALSQLIPQGDPPPSLELLDEDPITYMQMKAQYDAKQAENMQSQQRVRGEVQRLQQERLAQEYNALRDAMPELNDADKGPVLKQSLQSAFKEYGFSDDDISQISDHRAYLVMQDAMKYRQSLAKVEEVKKPLKAKPKVLRPGAKRSASQTQKDAVAKQEARLKQTGSTDDAAALISNFL